VDWGRGDHPGLMEGLLSFLFPSAVCNNISLLRLGVKVGLKHLVFDSLRKWTRFCDCGEGPKVAFIGEGAESGRKLFCN
jgi:hypothetical protein